jgi:hypothetical protein
MFFFINKNTTRRNNGFDSVKFMEKRFLHINNNENLDKELFQIEDLIYADANKVRSRIADLNTEKKKTQDSISSTSGSAKQMLQEREKQIDAYLNLLMGLEEILKDPTKESIYKKHILSGFHEIDTQIGKLHVELHHADPKRRKELENEINILREIIKIHETPIPGETKLIGDQLDASPPNISLFRQAQDDVDIFNSEIELKPMTSMDDHRFQIAENLKKASFNDLLIRHFRSFIQLLEKRQSTQEDRKYIGELISEYIPDKNAAFRQILLDSLVNFDDMQLSQQLNESIEKLLKEKTEIYQQCTEILAADIKEKEKKISAHWNLVKPKDNKQKQIKEQFLKNLDDLKKSLEAFVTLSRENDPAKRKKIFQQLVAPLGGVDVLRQINQEQIGILKQEIEKQKASCARIGQRLSVYDLSNDDLKTQKVDINLFQSSSLDFLSKRIIDWAKKSFTPNLPPQISSFEWSDYELALKQAASQPNASDNDKRLYAEFSSLYQDYARAIKKREHDLNAHNRHDSGISYCLFLKKTLEEKISKILADSPISISGVNVTIDWNNPSAAESALTIIIADFIASNDIEKAALFHNYRLSWLDYSKWSNPGSQSLKVDGLIDSGIDRLNQEIIALQKDPSELITDSESAYKLMKRLDLLANDLENDHEKEAQGLLDTVDESQKPMEWSSLCEIYQETRRKKQNIFDVGQTNVGDDETTQTTYVAAMANVAKFKEENLIGKSKDLITKLRQLNQIPEDEYAAYMESLNNTSAMIDFLPNSPKQLESFSNLNHYMDAMIESGQVPKQTDWNSVTEQINRYKDSVDNIQSMINHLNASYSHLNNTMAKAQDAINNSSPDQGGSMGGVISFAEMKEIFKLFYDSYKNNWTRRSADRVGQTTHILAKAVGYTKLAEDALQKARSAEKQAVDEIMGTLKEQDPWAIIDELAKTKNKDFLKAALLTLAEKGRLEFENPLIYQKIAQMSGYAVVFGDYLSEANDTVIFDRKFKRGVEKIWGDKMLFDQLQQSNESAWSSNKSKYAAKAPLYATNDQTISPVVGDMLKRWFKEKETTQNPSTFDPAEYEAYVEFMTDQGRGDPHDKLYYLIQGVVHGILPRRRLAYFASKFGNPYPVMEIFEGIKDYSYWQHVARIDGPPSSFSPGIAFKAWNNQVVLRHPRIKSRLTKILSQKKGAGAAADHDEITGYSGGVDDVAIKELLSKQSGDNFPATGLPSLAIGLNFTLKASLCRWNRDSVQERDTDFTRAVNAWIAYYAIGESLMYRKKDNYMRFGPTLKAEKPRNSIFGDEDKKPFQAQLDIGRKLIVAIEPTFFEMLFSPQPKPKELIEYVTKYYSHVFDKTPGRGPEYYFDPKNPDANASMDRIFDELVPILTPEFLSKSKRTTADGQKTSEPTQSRFGDLAREVSGAIKAQMGDEKQFRNFLGVMDRSREFLVAFSEEERNANRLPFAQEPQVVLDPRNQAQRVFETQQGVSSKQSSAHGDDDGQTTQQKPKQSFWNRVMPNFLRRNS